jgi:hypothetical protein
MRMINGKYILFLAILSLIGLMAFNVYKRNKILESSKTDTIVKITKLNFRKKGTTTRTTDAYYQYSLSDGTIIYGKTEINNPSVEVGLCYKAIYAKNEPDVVKIYFGKPVTCVK